MSLRVRQALTNAFLNADFELDTVHQNGAYTTFADDSYTSNVGTYTPTTGRPYCELRMFDAGTDAATLNSWDEELGIFQIMLYYPEHQGAIPADTKVKAITDAFYLYSTHTYLTQSVQLVNGRSVQEGVNEEGWYKLRIRLPYRAFTPR